MYDVMNAPGRWCVVVDSIRRGSRASRRVVSQGHARSNGRGLTARGV
jgi:hypothetical protein